MTGIHHNTKEWQSPEEFLPERFDPESPLFLTPSGKARNQYSHFAFSGGKRICFGKTIAEMMLKYMATYLSQYFEFEYTYPELYEDHYPRAFMLQPRVPEVMVRLTKRQ